MGTNLFSKVKTELICRLRENYLQCSFVCRVKNKQLPWIMKLLTEVSLSINYSIQDISCLFSSSKELCPVTWCLGNKRVLNTKFFVANTNWRKGSGWFYHFLNSVNWKGADGTSMLCYLIARSASGTCYDLEAQDNTTPRSAGCEQRALFSHLSSYLLHSVAHALHCQTPTALCVGGCDWRINIQCSEMKKQSI